MMALKWRTDMTNSIRVRIVKYRKALLLFGVFCVAAMLVYSNIKRTGVGQHLRALATGRPLARIWVDDLVKDVQDNPSLAQLQEWSEQTLARYRAGQLATNGQSILAGPFAIRLASDEVPDWLRNAWVRKPEVSIQMDITMNPECVHMAWYLTGIMVGPSNYVLTSNPDYVVQIKPGMYCYGAEK